MNEKIPWGQKVKELRAALDLSMMDFAVEVGVDQSTVAGWEMRPNRKPHRLTRQSVEKLAKRHKLPF